MSDRETDRHGFSGHLILADGTRVPFRPIRPRDASNLQRFHRGLSDRSRYQRFFGVVPELSDVQARHFTHLDGTDRFALVALDPADAETIVGVVRFDLDPGTRSAEYAAVVTDAWQGRGVGSALTRQLIASARELGIDDLYAMVLPENQAMLKLLKQLGYPRRVAFEDRFERVHLDLTTPPEESPS